jgi:hypothetical protein
MLLLSTVTVLVSAEPTKKPDATFQRPGNVHVDASAVLETLGYTKESMSNIPSKLMVQIIRSYNVMPVLGEDGDYYLTITTDSPRAEVNLIGTDRVSPYDLDLSKTPDSQVVSDAKESSGGSLDSLLDQRAALCFGVWDYPGETIDLPSECEEEFDAFCDDISTTSAYDYWHFMENDDCTWYNVWAWTTWACATYSNVDVYWNGHGIEVESDVGYVCYDAWIEEYQWIFVNYCYFDDDFTTSTYDYSTLRVGLGSFCYALGFSETFLNPGGSTSHTRAFMGTDTLVNVDYSLIYVETFGDEWYHDYNDSEDSHDSAASTAVSSLQPGEASFTYEDTGDPIYR